MKKPVIERYLARYAEPEAARVINAGSRTGLGTYADILVVPLYDESAEALWQVVPNTIDDLLLIAVVNSPQGSTDEGARNRTLRCLQRLRASATDSGREQTSLVPLRPAVDALVVDRVASIPARQGVGLARKIGADIGLALIQAGVVRHPRIHTTDADAVLPESYFSSARETAAIAWAFRFRHHHPTDPTLHRAGQLYEAYLRWYRQGLASAGSRYAHHSLGSALGVSATSYAMVRGFPKRAAGEDFYLLNKLAKIGSIAIPDTPAIRVEARASTRTPFGTGRSLASIPTDSERYLGFDPCVFGHLRTALQRLHDDDLARSDDVGRALVSLGAPDALARLNQQSHSTERHHQAIDDWFDALRTLRFLHKVRDLGAPDVPLLPILRNAGHLPDVELDAGLDGMNDAWCEREQAAVTSGY